jgi:hypothetical protein
MRSVMVVLLKGCYLGNAGARMRLAQTEARKACEQGLARYYEWKPSPRKVHVDVKKGVPNGNP